MKPVVKRLRACLVGVAFVLIGSTCGYMVFEHAAWWDEVYFTIVTVSTVGYGDMVPTTAAGKMLAVAVIVVGVGAFLGLVASITEIILERHERVHRRRSMNIVTSLFFSELGTDLLCLLSARDCQAPAFGDLGAIEAGWNERQFHTLARAVARRAFQVDMTPEHLRVVRDQLGRTSGLLMRIMENPHLAEHEHFTDLLMALLHVHDELRARPCLTDLPASDWQHLLHDVSRAYGLLARHWLTYLQYLRSNYPYLFSLALRRNPFDPQASVLVQ